MANLLSKLTEDLNSALKQKDEIRVSTLRFLIAGLGNARIAKGSDLDDDEILEETAKDAKRHRESIEAFEKGGRNDLVEKEKTELAILEEYLPKQLPESEIQKIVVEAIVNTHASAIADLGKVMAEVMPKVKGRADGSMISAIVKARLNG